MNKTQLIDAVAEKVGLTKTDAKRTLEAFIETITDALKNDERVTWVGFGSFSVLEREARIGRNPQTGQTLEIPARKVVKFKPGTDLM